MTTTDRVVEILVGEGGYRELPRPFKVGSLSFEFTQALIASEKANDLVVVIELTGDTADDVVTRKVLALTRALDVMRSKRPVTAVLTSGQPRSDGTIDQQSVPSALGRSADRLSRPRRSARVAFRAAAAHGAGDGRY